MSMHKKPLTDLERAGLIAHGLDIGTPSQLSDVFRHGIAYALAATPAQAVAELSDERVQELALSAGVAVADLPWYDRRALQRFARAVIAAARTQQAQPPAEPVAWLNRKYQTLHHASGIDTCDDVSELVPPYAAAKP